MESNDPSDYLTANRIVRLQLEIAERQEELDTLKGYFRNTQSKDVTSEDGPAIIVKVSPNTRIDDNLARKALDPDTYATVSKTVIDTAKARAFLDDQSLAKITKIYDNKVEVKLA